MNYDMKQSGNRIRQLRMKHGLTQEKVAALINIDRSFYGRIEAGQKGCSVDLFVQLSEIFHVSLDYLILGRHLTAMPESSDMVQLKEDINNLVAHLEQFKSTL